MEELLNFESSVYNEGDFSSSEIGDLEFWVNRIVILPSIRPFSVDKAVNLSIKYGKNAYFKEFLLEESFESCPVLIHRLYQKGFFGIDEIQPYFLKENCFHLCFYFRKMIVDFNGFIVCKEKPRSFDESFIWNEEDIDLLIKFGYKPSTIEYCLKYDDIDAFKDIFPIKPNKARISPFEWSNLPKSLDYLSFSSFFGSIKCFKYMLVNGFSITENVIASVMCSGNMDLFHICEYERINYSTQIQYASKFNHLSFVKYCIDNGAKVSEGISKDSPLIEACKYGHLGIVVYLVSIGVNVNGTDLEAITFFLADLRFIGPHSMDIGLSLST